MFGDFDLLIWSVVILLSAIGITKLIILPFFREFTKAGHRARKIDAEQNEQLNVKNLANTAGSFAESEITRYVDGLKIAHSQSMKIYAEQKEKGATPEVLEPLGKKIKQIEWLLTHETELKMMNKALTGPIISKFAHKILGGFL